MKEENKKGRGGRREGAGRRKKNNISFTTSVSPEAKNYYQKHRGRATRVLNLYYKLMVRKIKKTGEKHDTKKN